MPSERYLTADSDDVGGRIDAWLHARMPEVSRSRICALIRSGAISADGRKLTPHSRVNAGLRVHVVLPAPEPSVLVPEAVPLDVLFEDKHVIVVNKQAGLVVHPAAGHASGTLVNALLHHCDDLGGIGGTERPGIVHRLDKDTTGVLIAAKTDAAMGAIMDQFRDGAVRKEYLAIVHGHPSPSEDTIETLIGRSVSDRKKMAVRPAGGRNAVTHYRVGEVLGAFSLVRVTIATGRTHQIRVHMAHIGCPIVGDPAYGSRRRDRGLGINRQMLHARLLGLRHPETGESMTFEAPLPGDMDGFLVGLRSGHGPSKAPDT